ncbi:S41 family peptidase [Shewanella sp. SR44-3]|uniref:S41 family peptidase n=1 Tax=Shewanella sp. SR44-3 TaxID=2760936 RepID=UPI0015FCD5B0|nr:S41 family peptidase [Shewanella sp. SR44-3]MBB1270508.1 peptidase S41 [Shewanella sp. SR44-3]
MYKKCLSVVLSSALAFMLSTSVHAGKDNKLTKEDKIYGLSLYWKEARDNFAYFDQVPDLDFDAAYQSFIPRVLATESDYEYYRELMRFNALLKDGHTNVFLPKGLAQGQLDWPGIGLYEANKEAVVISTSQTLQHKIPLGSTLLKVNDIDLATYLKDSVMPYIASSTEHILWHSAVKDALGGKPGTQVKLTLTTPQGEIKSLTLVRDSNLRKSTDPEDSKPISLTRPSSNGELLEFKWLEKGMGYLALNGFHDKQILADFYAVLDDIRKAKTLIIDLRFNGGGDSLIAAEILSHFSKTELKGAIWKTRKHIAAYKAWGKFDVKYQEYANDNAWKSGDMEVFPANDNPIIVPTYVLTSRDTASAAEDFLIYADSLPHFTLIGEKTYGSTGQPIFFDLPGGGSFRICTKRDTYPDGREFVGYGIIPDVLMTITPQRLIAEEDFMLKEAISRLR